MNALANPADDREQLLRMFPPDEDYEFRMNFRKVEDPRAYLGRSDDGALLRERAAILDAHPERHAGLLPEGERHFDDLASFLAEKGAIDASTLAAVRAEPDLQGRCVALAKAVEPDFAVMRKGVNRSIRLVGGCVCFPSSWSPEMKMGMELSDIHDAVPALNKQKGAQIHATLSHLQAGSVGMRADWSLKPTPELNYHPLEGKGLPNASAGLDDSFIRVERQMMVGLPKDKDGVGAFAFCIRIAVYRLLDMARDPELRAGVARALKTMPADVAAYKDLASARGPLVERLEASAL